METSENNLEALIKKVIGELSDKGISVTPGPVSTKSCTFENIDEAIDRAFEAQSELSALTLDDRQRILESMIRVSREQTTVLGEMAVNETGLGRMPDKSYKIQLVLEKTPLTEDIRPYAFSGDHGMTLVERAPYGVIGAISPSTNPVSTVINNALSAIAAGNSIVFNPHPAAKNVTIKTIQILRQGISDALGPENLITTVAEPTRESGLSLFKNEKVAVLLVTGGEAIVRLAMNSGKKVIAAGPGNPPVIVDETADIDKAAKDIVLGASFDNGVVCVLEKEVFVVESVATELVEKMQKHGAFLLNEEQVEKLTSLVIAKDEGEGFRIPVINKKWVGKDAGRILAEIGISGVNTGLGIFEVKWDHPMVQVEQLMPMLPVVRVKDFAEAADLAVKTEHGFRHTFVMHSKNIENLSRMARMCNASIFVKNGPSLSGLGYKGEGFTTMSIATPTGEGLTRARTFTRERRCTLVDYFRII